MLVTDFFQERVAKGQKPMIVYTALCQSLAKNGTIEEFQALTNEYQKTQRRWFDETSDIEQANA